MERRIKRCLFLALIGAFFVNQPCESFSTSSLPNVGRQSLPRTIRKHHLHMSNRNNNIPDNNAASTATGAILGGLIGGPFGLLFGASIGSNLGNKFRADTAKKAEMERLGITPDMLEMANEVGVSLSRGMEGLEATRESYQTMQRLAKNLSSQVDDIYEKAKVAIENEEEDKARKLLMDRVTKQEKLKSVLEGCVNEKKRMEQMEDNVAALEERAMEVEMLIKKAVGAKATMDTNNALMDDGLSSLSLAQDDPLLKKFKDAGID